MHITLKAGADVFNLINSSIEMIDFDCLARSTRYNARSDWLIVGEYSPVIPTGRLRAFKN